MNKAPLYNQIFNTLLSKKRYKIVFIGDSLTSTEWNHPNWREVFEYILKFSFDEFTDEEWWIPEWNINFFNYALDGASTKNFLEQAKLSKKEINPNLYIIMGTSNDIELGFSIEEHIQNLTKIFNVTKGKHVIYTPDLYSKNEASNKAYEGYVKASLNIKTEENVFKFNGYEIFKTYPINNFYTLKLDNDIDSNDLNFKNDPVHPNVLGNIYIAKMFLEENFGIKVNSEQYLEDIRSDTVKYPRWK